MQEKLKNLSMNEIILKINEFTRHSRERELTDNEKIEREEYRKAYLDMIRSQVKGHLDKITLVDENGKILN